MKVQAVLFDMDGTITEPFFDFEKIRAEIGGITGPVLEAIQVMPAVQQERATEILHRYEYQAAEDSVLNEGATEVCGWLRAHGIATGLITRNQRPCVQRVCAKHGLRFDCVVTRDDGPVKPDGFPVRHACQQLEVAPGGCVVVGDYLFDLLSAHSAGAKAVLLTTHRNHADYAGQADYVIDSLHELPGVIEAMENHNGP